MSDYYGSDFVTIIDEDGVENITVRPILPLFLLTAKNTNPWM